MLKRILVADDSRSIREYLVTMLHSQTEAEVMGVADGQEALDQIQQGYQPDLVLLDLNMPKLDGVQLLGRLAELNFAPPIVIISGLSQQIISTIEKLSNEYQLNVLGTIGKPIDENAVSELLERLRTHRPAKDVVNEIKTYEVLEALEEGQVEPWFQPQVELQRRRLVGFEVLCRIRHKKRGLMLPNSFMSTLEKSDLIRVVTFNLMNSALRNAASLPSNQQFFTLSFNISAQLFDNETFIDDLIDLINESPIANDRIIIEITETTVARKPIKELEGAARISIAGCGLSIDDFGSGEATLERLHALPFTELKIDQQYLPKDQISEAQRALLESTINMARRLSIKVVIEGVESFRQWDLVQHLGCEMAQGYFIAAPMAFDEVSNWITQWQTRT